MEDINKNVDESWKDSIAKEKQSGEAPKPQEQVPEASFSFFVSTLSLQASIFLGLIPNPATKKREKNLEQARFIIDTLNLLKDKTEGNLTGDESNLLENMLYELRTQYISASKENQK